ncbi:MAG: acyltransferase [Legionellales bacterium]|nr:acyltransferase [Legionellales bacterium]
MLPEDALEIANSSMWSLFSLANVYFWLYLDTSYFAPASNQIPLLHLWTIGIEEQFYLFWPFLTFLFYRGNSKKWFFILLTFIAIASFWFAQWFYFSSPKFTFYMLPSRAGEFIVGILAAGVILNYSNKKIPVILLYIGSSLGLSLLLYSIIYFSMKNVFPGYLAILPTIGTALLILSGYYNSGWITKILALKPFTMIGKISYSAYLWHWPILAIYRYVNYEVTLISGIIIFILILVISWLSYRYIEQPFRNTNKSAAKILLYYLIATGILSVSIFVFINLKGHGFRNINSYKHKTVFIDTSYAHEKICLKDRLNEFVITSKKYVLGHGTTCTPKVLLWGDSNAAHLTGLIETFAETGNFSFRNIAVQSCAPLTTIDPKYFIPSNWGNIVQRKINDCRKSLSLTKEKLMEYDVIIMGGRWDRHAIAITRNSKGKKDFYEALSEQVRILTRAGKTIIIIGASPLFPGNDRKCERKAISLPFTQCKRIFPVNKRVTTVNKALKEFAKLHENVEYYSFNDYLCKNGFCYSYIKDEEDEIYLPYDAAHLRYEAMRKLGKIIISKEGDVPLPFRNLFN